MKSRTRWGIIGAGGIARKMATALNSISGEAELLAIGSRTQEKADTFGEQFGIPRRYACYEALAADADIDIVYVATPHNYHKDTSLLCLEHGKPVLCEKPIAVNAREAEELIRAAREKRLFLMEAMWTRFLPIMGRFREALGEGVIGEVRAIYADFGFRGGWNPEGRWLNPNLAGGALLDVGCYPISFAHWILGAPSRIVSLAHIGETGVDEQNAVVLGYDHGQLAIVPSAVRTTMIGEAHVMGTEGAIRLHRHWWCGSRMTIVTPAGEETIEAPYEFNGFECQARAAMRCLREGRLESETMPLDESLAIMRTMDEIRKQWGLKYPFE